jgi:hypothetical protein
LKKVQEKADAKLAEEPRKARRHYEKEKKIFDDAMKLQQSGKAKENWSSTDYTVMIKFKLLKTSNFGEEKPKMPSLKAKRQELWQELKKKPDQELWQELKKKPDPEPPQCPEFLDDVPSTSDEESNDGNGPPMIPCGISADEYSSMDGSSDKESDDGSDPTTMLRGISANEYSSDEDGDSINHFSSDEESKDGFDPLTIVRGISAGDYSSNDGRDEEIDDCREPPTMVRGISTNGYGSEVDDLFFFGSGQPIESIRPARLSETSELTDDDVGELAMV